MYSQAHASRTLSLLTQCKSGSLLLMTWGIRLHLAGNHLSLKMRIVSQRLFSGPCWAGDVSSGSLSAIRDAHMLAFHTILMQVNMRSHTELSHHLGRLSAAWSPLTWSCQRNIAIAANNHFPAQPVSRTRVLPMRRWSPLWRPEKGRTKHVRKRSVLLLPGELRGHLPPWRRLWY